MNRFYYINKPIEYSSFDVIRVLKKKLNIKRIGHTGTLDPLATGGLLIATGNYTKLISYLEKDKKTYEFEISLDGTTDSFDLAEEIKFLYKEKQEYFKKKLNKEFISEIVNKNFKGKIEQIPPKYSALKINGVRAYKLARQGKEVNIKKRKVEIFNIEILDFEYPKLQLKAEVSAGTYIRSIASDLGELLGTGGYITKLRRTKIENLDINNAQELDTFDASKNMEESSIFRNIEFVQLDDKVLKKIDNGLVLKGNFDFPIDKILFVYNQNKITNIIEYDGEKIKPIRKI